MTCHRRAPAAPHHRFRQCGRGIVPPQNPGGNITPAPGYAGPCGSLAAPNPFCPSGLTKIFGDRQAEGISPMSLPSNYGPSPHRSNSSS